ncbi:putative eukaryotic membrane protein [Gregarina niphandrodes]|uniref:Eukaryotic membrane protein n=1 Tax=Gregarina niphandrodes TaxID=110365 RepID=A0A023B6A4_GRENI|nr:putative eukaryotic membrane protein [Gregarina niphandrodes]EZG65881.1 putative eukaryotic membrane protein [Gregarina niphandrodes]|eukprot:XP_011134039.1 putative eukaryotic membrane protein [Gregarina niphandrodes]
MLEVQYDGCGLSYMSTLSGDEELSLLTWMKDEFWCKRPVCRFVPEDSESPGEVRKSVYQDRSGYTENRGTIPQTQLRHFLKTFMTYESLAFWGLLVCFQQFCYDITWMPLKAAGALGKILRMLWFNSFRGLYRYKLKRINSLTGSGMGSLRMGAMAGIGRQASPRHSAPPCPTRSNTIRRPVVTGSTSTTSRSARSMRSSDGQPKGFEDPLPGPGDPMLNTSAGNANAKPGQRLRNWLNGYRLGDTSPALPATPAMDSKRRKFKLWLKRLGAPGYKVLQETGRLLECRLEMIGPTDVSNLSTLMAFLLSYWLFRRCVSFSAAYHFIRSQSLLKLYVIFNVLEVVDRMWRSLERDALYELMANMNRLFCDLHPKQKVVIAKRAFDRKNEPGGDHDGGDHQERDQPAGSVGGEREATSPGGCWRESTESSFMGVTEGLDWCSAIGNIVLNLTISVLCISSHVVMHLARGLLLCISMTSEPTAMFLLLFSNNWAELKGTVFKKQTLFSLFTLVSGDIIERFQVFTDALFVYLQMNSALRVDTEGELNGPTTVVKWLTLMFAIEVMVDFCKYAFLIKFNKLSYMVFSEFEWVLGFDYLVSRSPTFLVTRKHSVKQLEVPVKFQGMAPFSRISAERLGFQTLALLIFLLSCLPISNLLQYPFLSAACLLLTWTSVVLLNSILSLFLMAYCSRHLDSIMSVTDDIAQLTSQ